MPTSKNVLADVTVWTARDLMSPTVVTVRPDDTVREAAALLLERNVHGAPVVDDDGRAIGVLSMTDLARHERERVEGGFRDSDWYRLGREGRVRGIPWERGFHLEVPPEATVREWMSPFVVSVYEDATLADVLGILLRNQIHRVIVVREPGPQLVGVISETDLLVALYAALVPDHAPVGT